MAKVKNVIVAGIRDGCERNVSRHIVGPRNVQMGLSLQHAHTAIELVR